MPSRVLETVLTGRNLLSPVLAGAAKDVEGFNVAVTDANAQSAAGAETSAAAQDAAAAKVVEANTRVAESAKVSGAEQTTAQRGAAAEATKAAEVQSAASTKVVEANTRSRESAALLAETTDSSALRTGMAWQKLATVGLPLVAVAVTAVTGKMAGDYQQLVTKLETTAGESKANLGTVSQGMLDMAGKVGISADELAKGMYTVESAGFHGAAGLNVLKAGAQGAVQEQADLSHVVDAVTTSLHDYHLPATDAAKVTSELISAVSHGKTTFDDLTGAMHSIEPVAVGAGLTIAQTAGALSAMTASGMHADQAAQNLAHTIGSFQNATKPMRDELSQLGLDATDLQQHMGERGIAGTLQLVADRIRNQVDPSGKLLLSALQTNKTAVSDLSIMIGKMPPQLADLASGLLAGTTTQKDFTKAAKDLGGSAGAMADQFLSSYKGADGFSAALKSGGPMVQTYISALAKATGTADGLRTALMLTGENAAGTNAAIADIAGTAAQADGSIKGWSEVQGNFNQKLHEAEAGAGALAIEFGQHMLPALTAGLGWVADHGVPALQDLGHWLGQVAQSSAVQASLHGIADAGQILWTVLKGVAGVIEPIASGLGHLFGSLPGPVQAVTLALLAFNVARNAGWLSPGGAAEGEASAGIIRRSLASVGAAATEAAMVTASSFGQMKAAYAEAAAAAQVSAEIQGESLASTKIAGALAGTTAAAKNLATQGFGAIKSGATGLMNMFGGPWGMAFIAATVGITSYYDSMQQLAAAEKAARTSGEELYNTYVKLGTVYGQQADAARETVKQQTGLNDIAQRAGVSQDTLTQALEGNAQAQKKVTDATGGMSDRWNAMWSGSFGDFISGNFMTKDKDVWTSIADGLGKDATNAQLFMSSIDDTKGALQDYQDTANRIFGPGNLANQGVSTLQKGMDELATSAGDTQKSLQGITDILAGLTGKGASAAQATADLTSATVDTTAAFKQMTAGALDSTGAIDLHTQAGLGLWNSLKDVSSGFKTAVNDAYNSALATGTATDASIAAGKAADTLYSKFILTATGAGMSQQAAQDLAKQLGLVPGDVVTQFTTPGLNAAQAGVQILQGQVNVITSGPHDVTVTALTQTAENALTAVGVHVTHLPDGTVSITANTYPAQSALDNFLRANASHVITVGIAGTNNAAYTGTGISVNGRTAANATGGVIHAYAGGGIEAMTAGIAKVVHPNTLRVIGDRVKDDEFYIPDNNDPRSQQIGAEYVRRHPDVAMAALGMGSGATYNAAGTGFTAAGAPGYSSGAATATGAVIDYGRLGQAVAAAMQATSGRSGPLVEMNGVSIGDQSDANQLAERLAHIGRTRGW